MKTFEAKFNKGSDGVFAISLVTAPATQENFIALSEQKEIIKLAEVDKEQRILMGLVLQPNQLIYRKQGGKEFNIVFSEDTIKDLSYNFFKSGFQLNSKLEHEDPIRGVTFVESWIVENPSIDKSANFGMEYPKGTWMAIMKVDNNDIWDSYIKTGKIKGFSVDAMVDLEEINLKTSINMIDEKKTLLEKMEVWFTNNVVNKQKEDATEEKTVELAEGDSSVEEMPEDDEKKEDGTLLTDAVIDEIIKMLLDKQSESMNTELSAFKELYQTELTAVKAELLELKNEPAANPIVAIPTQVKLTKSGKILEKLRNNK